MNKKFISIAIGGLLVLSGCGALNQLGAERDGDIYEESGNTINVNDERVDLYNVNNDTSRNNYEDFGYVRHQKNPIAGRTNGDYVTSMDREEMADSISKFVSDLPNVNDAATLVTDEEVLVVYNTDSKDRNLTADQVKRSALSVIPRYYHVYVSDNFNLLKNLESFGTLSSNSRNVDDILDNLIVQMLKSPQGKRVSEEENENGLSNDELDEHPSKGSTTNVTPVRNR